MIEQRDRNEAIFAMRRNGAKLREIAAAFGLTRSRCQQIYEKECWRVRSRNLGNMSKDTLLRNAEVFAVLAEFK